jgi:uncharacterized membrane protein
MKPGAGETDAEPEKMATLAFLTLLCVFLEILMHYTLGVAIGYTHFFYVVLVLAAIWYGKKAAIIAACLAVTHFAFAYFVFSEALWVPLLRGVMFVIVTLLVGALSEEQKESARLLVASNERYIGYIKEAAMRLKTPVEVVGQNLVALKQDVEEQKIPYESIAVELSLQAKHMEQIHTNLTDLNKTIVDGFGEMSPASKQFLTE